MASDSHCSFWQSIFVIHAYMLTAYNGKELSVVISDNAVHALMQIDNPGHRLIWSVHTRHANADSSQSIILYQYQ